MDDCRQLFIKSYSLSISRWLNKTTARTMVNHASHVDFRVIDYSKENGIVLLTFPPHCSHALQPCDVSVFGPFKRALRSSHNDWIQMNPGKRISIKETAGLSKGPFLSKVTAENIIPGFSRLVYGLLIGLLFPRLNLLHL